MFRDRSGRLHVAEVEGTEPSLFFPDPVRVVIAEPRELGETRRGPAHGFCAAQVNLWILCRIDKHVDTDKHVLIVRYRRTCDASGMTEGYVKDRYAGSYDAAMQIVDAGYARRRLRPDERAALECLRSIAGRFFARDLEWKNMFCGGATGYQPYGNRWADPDTDDPARRDGCERLDNWSGHRIPGAGQMPMLQVALNWWQRIAARIAGQVLDGIATHYAYQRTWDFRPTSWLEASWYPDRGDGIAQHTDGHLITVLAADGPGLEADTGTGMAPLWGGPGELVILPGELMSAMTAGQIPPLSHQVAGNHRPGRLSVMYFVNPPFKGQVAPYAGGRADIADLALTRCTMFGQQVPADLLPLTGLRGSGCGPGRRTVRPAAAPVPAWPA